MLHPEREDRLKEQTGVSSLDIEQFAFPGDLTEDQDPKTFQTFISAIAKAASSLRHPDTNTQHGREKDDMHIGKVDVRDLGNIAAQIRQLEGPEISLLMGHLNNERDRLAELREEGQNIKARYEQFRQNALSGAIIEQDAVFEHGTDHIARVNADIYRRDYAGVSPLVLARISFQEGEPEKKIQVLQPGNKGKINGTTYENLWEKLESVNKALVRVQDGTVHELVDGEWKHVEDFEVASKVLKDGHIVFSPLVDSPDIAYVEYPTEKSIERDSNNLHNKRVAGTLKNHDQLPDIIYSLQKASRTASRAYRNQDLQLPQGEYSDDIAGGAGTRYIMSPELYYALVCDGQTAYSIEEYYAYFTDTENPKRSLVLRDEETHEYSSVDFAPSFMHIDRGN